MQSRIFFNASAAWAGHCRRQERGGQQERQESKRVTCRQAKPTATGEWQVLLLSKPAVRPPRPTLLPEGGSDRVTRNTKEMLKNCPRNIKKPKKYQKIQKKYQMWCCDGLFCYLRGTPIGLQGWRQLIPQVQITTSANHHKSKSPQEQITTSASHHKSKSPPPTKPRQPESSLAHNENQN